jgi:hypothetical protein
MDPAPLSVDACLIPSRILAVLATRAIGVVASALRDTNFEAGATPAAVDAVERLATDCLGRALVSRAMLVRAAISVRNCAGDEEGDATWSGGNPQTSWLDGDRLVD